MTDNELCGGVEGGLLIHAMEAHYCDCMFYVYGSHAEWFMIYE